MPIIKSAIKHMRADERKRVHNQKVHSELKTLFKKVSHLATTNLEKAKEESRIFISKLDKAAQKGIIPKERANRKKSRLSAILAKGKS